MPGNGWKWKSCECLKHIWLGFYDQIFHEILNFLAKLCLDTLRSARLWDIIKLRNRSSIKRDMQVLNQSIKILNKHLVHLFCDF